MDLGNEYCVLVTKTPEERPVKSFTMFQMTGFTERAARQAADQVFNQGGGTAEIFDTGKPLRETTPSLENEHLILVTDTVFKDGVPIIVTKHTLTGFTKEGAEKARRLLFKERNRFDPDSVRVFDTGKPLK